MSSNPPTWKRLINPSLSVNEHIGLIMTIFSDRDEAEVTKYLSGDDAQAFVDTIHEVCIIILFLLTPMAGSLYSAKTSVFFWLGFGKLGRSPAENPREMCAFFIHDLWP